MALGFESGASCDNVNVRLVFFCISAIAFCNVRCNAI